MVVMDGKPEVIAFMLGEEIAPDDPYRHIKERALAIDAAAEELGRAARVVDVDVNAGVIDQAAGLFCSEAFDPAETYDACEAAGMTDGQADAAAYIAVTLGEIELDAGG